MKFKLFGLITIFLLAASFSYASAVVNKRKQNAEQMQHQRQIQQHKKVQQIQAQDPQRVVEKQADEVSDMRSIWKELEITSEVWPLIIDNEPKLITVKNYIKLYAKKGIVIRKEPQHYVDMIDEMAYNNSEMLKNPFFELIRFAAIVEYDFDNGVHPDVLAKEILGDKVYRSNRKRLGLE